MEINIKAEPREIAALVLEPQGRQVDIYYRGKKFEDTDHRYLWADSESHEKCIFGRAYSLGEIQRRARNRFPGYAMNLVCF